MRPGLIVFLTSCILGFGCESQQEVIISWKTGELFSYELNACGDEEGAWIIEQAKHFSRSEIIRDSTTNFCPIYYYIPENGYSGLDLIIIGSCTGGKGLKCDEYNTIEISFKINE
jgi:hypothetical protein